MKQSIEFVYLDCDKCECSGESEAGEICSECNGTGLIKMGKDEDGESFFIEEDGKEAMKERQSVTDNFETEY